MKTIIKKIKSGELTRDIDETGSNGFWDLAGEVYNEATQDAIYNTLWGLYETLNPIETPCLYCESNPQKSEHFICNACGKGMCDECYDQNTEHDETCFDFHESIDDVELYNYIVEKTGAEYGYMCFGCIDQFTNQLKQK